MTAVGLCRLLPPSTSTNRMAISTAKPKLRKRIRVFCTAGRRLLASQNRTIGSPVKIAHVVTRTTPSSVTSTGFACWKTVTARTPHTIDTATSTVAAVWKVLLSGMNSLRNISTK